MVGDKEFITMQKKLIALEEENHRLRADIMQLRDSLRMLENYVVGKFNDINTKEVNL